MSRETKVNLGIGLICILIAYVYWHIAPEVEEMGYGLPPQIYEKILACAMALCGILSLGKSFLYRPKNQKESHKNEKYSLFRVLIITVVSLGYFYFLEKIGFIVVSVIAIFIILFTLGERKILPLVTIPLGCTLIIYILFYKVMGVLLPQGILG